MWEGKFDILTLVMGYLWLYVHFFYTKITKNKRYICCWGRGVLEVLSHIHLKEKILRRLDYCHLPNYILFSYFKYVLYNIAVYILHIKWSNEAWFPVLFSDLPDYTCSQGSFFIGLLV